MPNPDAVTNDSSWPLALGPDPSLLRGTLTQILGGFYTVETSNGERYTLRCKKKFRHARVTPLVGDEILFTPGEGEELGWLEDILPRRSECLRPPVANVECLVLVVAPVPEPDLLLIDRLLARARAQGISALLVVGKSDLDPKLAETLSEEYRLAEVPVIAVSARTGEGLDELRDAMRGHLCCFAGQSGVGKSSLLRALTGLELEVGSLSEKIARGRNTTRKAELLTAAGLRVFDTAGFSLLEPEKDTDPTTLKERYPEFLPYEGQCRFDSCCHDREPGCAVTRAAAEGLLPPERLSRYRTLLSELRETWRNRYD